MHVNCALVQFVHGFVLLHLTLRRRQLTQEKWLGIGMAAGGLLLPSPRVVEVLSDMAGWGVYEVVDSDQVRRLL